MENLVKGGRIGRVTGLLSSLLNIRVIMTVEDHQLEPVAKGRGNKTFKKWLDEFVAGLQGRQVAEIGISYAGSPAYAQEMKERLQPFVSTPISVLETSSIIASIQVRMLGPSWCAMNSRKILQGLVFFFTSLLGFVFVFHVLVPSAQPVLTKADYQTRKVRQFSYVALGDSLTQGVGDTTNQGGFVPLVAQKV